MSWTRTRRWLNVIGGFGLAALLLWLFFRRVDAEALGRSLIRADVRLLALALVTNTLSLAARSWRWQVLLRPVKPGIGFQPCWKYFNVGFAVSALLPGRLGELIRPYLLARDQGIRFGASLATVVVERVLELSIVLGLLSTAFFVPAVLGPRANEPVAAGIIEVIEGVALVALLVAAGTAAFLVALRTRTRAALEVIGKLTRPLPKRISVWTTELVQSFAQGIAGLKGPHQVFELAASTVLSWIVLLVGYWIQLAAFGIHVPFLHVCFLTSVLALGVVVPTPAGTGTFHAAMFVVVGELWTYSRDHYESVAGCAIVSHLIALIPILVFGVQALVRDGIDVFAAADQARGSSHEAS
jgi:uncharacterized protein (TIRG00374 family)